MTAPSHRTTAPQQDPPSRLYTPAEAADILTVRESWLRRQAGQRRIPCTFLGKHLRFSDADIQQIIAAGSRPTSGRRRTRRR
ncbi:DNA binding domain-containing protein, excisionase family [Lentzea albidocapillata subsp. violacea]|uniref:DNA binding domain-containing protein, excisionase family n=1 Tax=Lentzea albidocapillata subsp. violacea TaxID=128104 RepID=A0A1G9YI41_9PSEU|nr:helix-turn-helix domain-containing protein [Lentzea albidocapillata]SDN08151.1 DNA binding domain-containing protein, excisionase family [Lentzea albidocapillata subsp. violacea]